ncbi:hypothetical protein DH2020_000951 [Rehmannia glutinosa]|uniref:Homeobox domain-containing protein n=1 Tax=Rehmannia glutinosa TaxID=99300 RepID=A0ABR0XY18_REHGL
MPISKKRVATSKPAPAPTAKSNKAPALAAKSKALAHAADAPAHAADWISNHSIITNTSLLLPNPLKHGCNHASLNDAQSCGMNSEDDKAFPEKNKKRIVKTNAQVQALEKFYNEHKYPTELMKIQLAESIGLTEKQVSGWFCHRRLKDKRLMNGDNHVIGRQDRSSGVIQDRGSGHRQDSCGSTKLEDDRNIDSREVESGRLMAELTYERSGPYLGTHNRMDDASSGSNSSLRNVSNQHKVDPVDVETPRYLIPKFPIDTIGLKTRPGPSGYLKVKGQVENSAITAVKRQLGKHYREDGPPLGVEFDPLPPGAFESSMQDPTDGEPCYTGQAVPPASPDFPKIQRHPKFGKASESGCEDNSSMASHNSNMDRASFKMPQGPDIPENYVRQKFKQNTTFSNNGAYYPWRNSSLEMPEVSAREISGGESRDDYGMKYRKCAEVMKTSSVSSSCHLPPPFGGNSRREQESGFIKGNDVRRKSSKGETIGNGSSNLTMKGFEYHHSFDQMQARQIAKDGKTYTERRITNENQIRIPCKNDKTVPKRMRNEFPQQLHLKKPLLVDNQAETYRVTRSVAEMPSSFSEDEASAATSSSLE